MSSEREQLAKTFEAAGLYDELVNIHTSHDENGCFFCTIETATGYNKLLDFMAAQLQAARAEAQTNAIAWAVGVLDEFHTMPHLDSTERDKFYKGVKNGLRDRYRSETGIDPAPNYPIRATLIPKHKENK